MKKDILAIREKFSHMGAYSGYDQLFRYLEKDYKNELNLNSVWKDDQLGRFERKIYSKFANQAKGTPYYNLNSFKAEVKAFWHLLSKKPNILHISYLENNLGLGKWYKKRGDTKFIATVHQPASWWQSGIASAALVSDLDQLIVLDTPSKEYFSKYLDHNRIEIIKHGIDTEFFKPLAYKKEKIKPRFNCLFSGQWLRNIELLTSVIEYINSKKRAINFHIVHPYANQSDNLQLSKLAACKNTFMHCDLTDEDLRNIYQQSDIFLMPLIDCTANNGILEAMACGLPIVTTPVGGIYDYVTKDFAFLSNDAQKMGNHILELSENPLEALNRGKKAREHIEVNLKWEVIAEKTLRTYII